MTEDTHVLRADCSRCAALCCVALAFDEGQSFAIDKPAGIPCPHLGEGHQCTIHAQLEPRGFSGCKQYDCLGAGQRVVQEVFDGRSWRDEPALLAPMMDAFRGMRQLHVLLQMMEVAGKLPLTPAQKARHSALMAELRPAEGWTAQMLRAFETGPVSADVHAFLKSLKGHARALAPSS